MLLRDLRERHAGAAVSDDRFTIDIKSSTPDLTTLQAGTTHTRPPAFDDDAPLKLSQAVVGSVKTEARRELSLFFAGRARC
jgi:hypothetical protein